MIAKILVVVAVLGASSAASADVIYTYVGNAYTDIVDVPLPGGSFDTSMRVTGQFVLPDALPADLPITDLIGQITSFSFSNGRDVLTSADPLVSLAVFSVTTDAFAALDRWTISVQRLQAVNGGTDVAVNALNDTIFGFPIEDRGQDVACDPVLLRRGLCLPLADEAFVEGAPGGWTRSGPGADTGTDTGSVPEPATLTLCTLGGLAFLKRRLG